MTKVRKRMAGWTKKDRLTREAVYFCLFSELLFHVF